MQDPQTFETHNDQQFRPARAEAKVGVLPPGAYTMQSDMQGPFFQAHPLITDALIHSTDSREVSLRSEVRRFFTSAHLYQKHGFTHRRGILLHGPAGSGKSCLLRSFCQEHIDEGGYVLFETSDPPQVICQFTRLLQKRNASAQVIVVIEELEEYVSRHGEHGLLALLDGELSLAGALIVATTNYPEKLNKRVINRPRRFDRVLYVGMPGAGVRREYFQRKLHIEEDELEAWVAVSTGFSFAAMADLVISNKCLGIDLQKAATDIRNMQEAKPNSEWPGDGNITDDTDPHPTPAEPPQAPKHVATHPFIAEILDRFTPHSQIERIEESAQLSSAGAEGGN